MFIGSRMKTRLQADARSFHVEPILLKFRYAYKRGVMGPNRYRKLQLCLLVPVQVYRISTLAMSIG